MPIEEPEYQAVLKKMGLKPSSRNSETSEFWKTERLVFPSVSFMISENIEPATQYRLRGHIMVMDACEKVRAQGSKLFLAQQLQATYHDFFTPEQFNDDDKDLFELLQSRFNNSGEELDFIMTFAPNIEIKGDRVTLSLMRFRHFILATLQSVMNNNKNIRMPFDTRTRTVEQLEIEIVTACYGLLCID